MLLNTIQTGKYSGEMSRIKSSISFACCDLNQVQSTGKYVISTWIFWSCLIAMGPLLG